MRIPIYQVDAFSNRLFHGNPAAICPLEKWLPDATMQAIAAENNLAETAFYVRNAKSPNGGADYHIRWFTPGVEVDLCGHATVAAAHVIMGVRGEIAGGRVTFQSKSGELGVDKEGDLYALDFPSRPPEELASNAQLEDALGAKPTRLLGARDYLCVFESEEEVRALKPDMAKLMTIDRFAVIVTAPGTDCDFVSRFFAPAKGVPEDPVTGSAHCTLTPYWAKRLGKSRLFARQVSARGGELWVEDRGARVKIAGNAVLYLEGAIETAEQTESHSAGAAAQAR